MFISKKSRNISRRPLLRVVKAGVKPAIKSVVKKEPEKTKIEEPKPKEVEEIPAKKPRAKKVAPVIEEATVEAIPVEEKNKED